MNRDHTGKNLLAVGVGGGTDIVAAYAVASPVQFLRRIGELP